MDSMVDARVLSALGGALRAARAERGLDQIALGGREFSAAYIEAVEAGELRPSLAALRLLAGRLGLPLDDLLDMRAPMPAAPDRQALGEDIAYQLVQVRTTLERHHDGSALQMLNTAEQEYQPWLGIIAPLICYQLYMLRARIHVRLQRPVLAQQDLLLALAVAQEMGDDQLVVRVWNGLGAVYYEQSLPQQALEEHNRCLHAIETGLIKDYNLRLIIYTNLANDHWALNDSEQAIAMYREALKLAEDVNNPERQAAIYWGLAAAYRTQGNLDRAKLSARRAMTILESIGHHSALAQVWTNMAEILIDREEYDEAAGYLDRARLFEQTAGNTLLLAMIYVQDAILARLRQRLDSAQLYAHKAMVLCQQVLEQETGGDARARGNLLHYYALAAQQAGLIANQQEQWAEADAFFHQAIALIGQTQYTVTMIEIDQQYAELLVLRGAHEAAAQHFRAAFARRPLLPAYRVSSGPVA